MMSPMDVARDWECGTGMGAPVAHTLPLKKLLAVTYGSMPLKPVRTYKALLASAPDAKALAFSMDGSIRHPGVHVGVGVGVPDGVGVGVAWQLASHLPAFTISRPHSPENWLR